MRTIPPYIPPDDSGDGDDEDREYWALRYAEMMGDAFGNQDYFNERSQIQDPHHHLYVTTGEFKHVVQELERNGTGGVTGKYGLAQTYVPSDGRWGPFWYH